MRVVVFAWLAALTAVLAFSGHPSRVKPSVADARAAALQIAALYSYRMWGGTDTHPRVAEVTVSPDGLDAAVRVSFGTDGDLIVHLRRSAWANMGVD